MFPLVEGRASPLYSPCVHYGRSSSTLGKLPSLPGANDQFNYDLSFTEALDTMAR